MLTAWVPVLAILLAAVLFAGGSVVLSALLGPSKPTPQKLAPYECGIIPTSDARHSTWVRYYLIAMLFLLFDMEVVFLYPWAVVFRQLGLFGLGEMAVFVAVLIFGYAYAWKKGALEWD